MSVLSYLNEGSIVSDIETGPQAWEHIEKIAPAYEPPKHPGEFDQSTVKLGHLKDPAKIAAKIEEAKAKHEAAVADYEATVEAGRSEWKRALIEDVAPLDPTIGQVLLIGYRDSFDHCFLDTFHHDGEAGLISRFWQAADTIAKRGDSIIGHYFRGFDVPFLLRRSWILGLDVPSWLFEGRYLSSTFVCTKEAWLCGQKTCQGSASLDSIARAMAIGEKPEGVSGKDFWKLFTSGDSQKVEAAFEYAKNDLEMVAGVAVRMGLMTSGV